MRGCPDRAEVEYHHDKEAEAGGDNSFENCRAVCIPCHRLLTKAFIKGIRKADRQQAAHLNAAPPESLWQPSQARESAT